jgi:hypothetical protein
MDDKSWEKELWTQQEVAKYFRVVPGTVKNWRDQGLLSYWQAPGSTRVFYFSDEIKDFRDINTIPKKGGDRQTKLTDRRKPVVPTTSKKDKWEVRL